MAVKLFHAKIYAEIYTVYDQHSKIMFYFSTGSCEFFFTIHADLYCLLEYEVTMIKSKNYVTIIEFVKEMHSSITSMMLQLSMTLA